MLHAPARLALAAAFATAAASLCGCHSAQTTKSAKSTAAMGAINDKCPKSGKPVTADGGTETWRGHTIGFCCPACVKPWQEMSAKDKDAFVAKYTP